MTPISYHSGSVLSSTSNVHVLFYGHKSSNFFNVSRQKILFDFINNVGSSSWFSTASAYGVGNVQKGTTYYMDCESNQQGCDLQPNSIPQILWSTMSSRFPRDPNAIYVFAADPKTPLTFPGGSIGGSQSLKSGWQFCGCHSYFNDPLGSEATYKFIYIQSPDLGVSQCIFAPGGVIPASTPNGDVAIDMLIASLAHELIETLISPIARQTYIDLNGNEVMDK